MRHLNLIRFSELCFFGRKVVRKQWDLPGKISSTLWGKEDERDQGIREEAVGPARPNKLGPSSTTGESGYSDAGRQPADAVGERDDPPPDLDHGVEEAD